MAKLPAEAPPEAPLDAPLGAFTGYLLKRAFNRVQDDLIRTLEPFGLRMLSFSALLVVARNPDITQTQLGQALSVERSNIAVLLDGLEESGLVTRNPVPGNRRAYALRATLKGRRTADKAAEAVRAHEARLFATLGDDHAALRATLARFIADSR
ncbi:MAG TPA: MarR family transcriptional regulator [Paracoccaceae bacterium]|nr:MarR family transcriptional regulator [Paracoccaceae bacterium]